MDIPRAAATCTFNPVRSGHRAAEASRPATSTWSGAAFTGSTSTKIMFSRSTRLRDDVVEPLQALGVKLDQLRARTWRSTRLRRDLRLLSGAGSRLFEPAGRDPDRDRRRISAETFPSRKRSQVATIAPFDQATTPTRIPDERAARRSPSRSTARPSAAFTSRGRQRATHSTETRGS